MRNGEDSWNHQKIHEALRIDAYGASFFPLPPVRGVREGEDEGEGGVEVFSLLRPLKPPHPNPLPHLATRRGRGMKKLLDRALRKLRAFFRNFSMIPIATSWSKNLCREHCDVKRGWHRIKFLFPIFYGFLQFLRRHDVRHLRRMYNLRNMHLRRQEHSRLRNRRMSGAAE